MSVRKIRVKERKNGMKYCTFCKPAKIDAIYRDSYLNFACENCKNKLRNPKERDHYTEADYQTWLKL